MTNTQRLQLRQSEIRERLNVLSNPDAELTEDGKAEINKLSGEMADIEPKLRAAIIAEQEAVEARNDGNPETSDPRLDDLRKRATVSEYIRQAVHGQPLSGACLELNQELKIEAVRGQGGGVLLPVEQLALRADVPNTTTTTAKADETQRRPILSRLFARGVMDAMGVRLDSVPVGLIEYPILTDSVEPDMEAEEAEAETVAAMFNSQILKPKRLIARYEFTAEAIMTVPGLDAALSSDLQMAMTDQMNNMVLTGDGVAPNVHGLEKALNFTAITDPTNKITFGTAVGFGLEAIDGKHASSEADISIVLGPATYRTCASLLASGTTDNCFDVLRRRGMTIETSAHVAAPASNIQKAYVHAGRDMSRGDSVAAVWPAIELIRDPYTKAASSKTVITSVMLWDLFAGFRPMAYKGLKAKLA